MSNTGQYFWDEERTEEQIEITPNTGYILDLFRALNLEEKVLLKKLIRKELLF